MKRRLVISLVVTLLSKSLFAQTTPIVPSIARINDINVWSIENLSDSLYQENGIQRVKLTTIRKEDTNGSNVGIAWVKGLEFSTGIIEVELKGKNVRQQSFLGIAFNGVDVKHFEAIYFRPFNFKAADSLFRKRAVQYIAWPEYTWEKLRKETPWTYEKPVNNVADPDSWFKARIIITVKEVKVFVNGSQTPALTVNRILPNGKGKVGLWIDVADGHFANLKIVPDKKE